MDARLIIDAPASGSWNMAVDEVLFRGVTAGAPPAVRLYRWSEPTLSLGYFQRVSDRESHPPSRSLPLVRRATGGGAIVHDAEWTYSVTLRLPHDRPAAARHVLAAVHQSLVHFFQRFDIPVRPVGRSTSSQEGEPFLCFQRRTTDDLALGEHKVVGSAQRRHRSTLLQHGSILLRRSPAAPELPGIEDIQPVTQVGGLLAELWPAELASALDLSLSQSSLAEAESRLAAEIDRERFAASRWNEKR
jgi:lipoate-protein ligase A